MGFLLSFGMTQLMHGLLLSVRVFVIVVLATLPSSIVTIGWTHEGESVGAAGGALHGHGGHEHAATASQWEGSAAGKAYSEFNHHLAGLFVILIAISEWPGLPGRFLAFARFLLPLSLVCTGLFLLIWSDHDSWPIGPKTAMESFLTGDWETLQHKWFGVTCLAIGAIEWLRRVGGLDQPWTRFPLPLFAIAGGVSLFLHDHGVHPSAHQIAVHHAIMGGLAITAGTVKITAPGRTERSRWEAAWSVFVFLIGFQLLLYSE